ncbi:ankyrin repeat domain-containing protein [Rickettsiella massiliensis]|uniref:ankyrin repeat domain-containing protein n=1 Tax=Rickettsiella massiliensis TaxID=676517 RepID=UPI00029A7114|nr:ankyrin repeat domain-containing protein [Rickettsiella massiliensis]
MSPNKRKFYAAAEKGDLQKVKCYMDYNNVDEADRFGRTALFLVISKNYLSISQAHLSVIEFLLEHKANIYKMENRAGNTSLNVAKLSSNNAVLKLFLEKNRIDDSSKYKLIKELVMINNHDAAQVHNILLKIKCVKGTLAETQPVYSNENLRIEKIKLLIAHIEQVNKKEINDLLSLAIERNNIKTAKVFIDLILEKKWEERKVL